MGRAVTKTTIFTRPGRKELIKRRYGTLSNFYEAAKDDLYPAISNPQYMTKILDMEDCTEEQARAMEAAVEYYIDRPQRILDRMMPMVERGKRMHEIPVGDVMCLRAALRLDEKQEDGL